MKTQEERRIYLIEYLISEDLRYRKIKIPEEEQGQERLLRALLNLRPAGYPGPDFLEVQDEYLQEKLKESEVTDVEDLEPVVDNIYLWQGDITKLKAGAIVNAANSEMLGCFIPNHNCIDNAIHTNAGVRLREACALYMAQRHWKPEEEGHALPTDGYNLPAEYVFHTVGPAVKGKLRKRHEKLLKSCYRECLICAEVLSLDSIVFCCISTGVFNFPRERAAEIAVETVREYLEETGSDIKVVFDVFLDEDYEIYEKLLRG